MTLRLRSGQATVLFACVQNAGRSQIAAALFNALADPAKARAISAGTRPAAHVHPEVVDVLKEGGLDIGNVAPQRLTDDLARQAQVLITMGCGDQCPIVPGAIRDDWPIADPHGQPVSRVREIRDDIAARVEELIRRHGWAK